MSDIFLGKVICSSFRQLENVESPICTKCSIPYGSFIELQKSFIVCENFVKKQEMLLNSINLNYIINNARAKLSAKYLEGVVLL